MNLKYWWSLSKNDLEIILIKFMFRNIHYTSKDQKK